MVEHLYVKPSSTYRELSSLMKQSTGETTDLQYDILLKSIISITCKINEGVKQIVIKPSPQCAVIIHYEGHSEIKQIFTYRNPLNAIESHMCYAQAQIVSGFRGYARIVDAFSDLTSYLNLKIFKRYTVPTQIPPMDLHTCGHII